MSFPEPPGHGEITAVAEHMFDELARVNYMVQHLTSDVVALEAWLRAHTKAQHGSSADDSSEPPPA